MRFIIYENYLKQTRFSEDSAGVVRDGVEEKEPEQCDVVKSGGI